MFPIPSAALRSLTLAAGLLGCSALAAQTPSVLQATPAAAATTLAALAAGELLHHALHLLELLDQGRDIALAGAAAAGDAIPAIAGRGAETLYRALIEFKTGQRPAATVMHQHARGYSDDELRRLAQYFAALPVR